MNTKKHSEFYFAFNGGSSIASSDSKPMVHQRLKAYSKSQIVNFRATCEPDKDRPRQRLILKLCSDMSLWFYPSEEARRILDENPDAAIDEMDLDEDDPLSFQNFDSDLPSVDKKQVPPAILRPSDMLSRVKITLIGRKDINVKMIEDGKVELKFVLEKQKYTNNNANEGSEEELGDTAFKIALHLYPRYQTSKDWYRLTPSMAEWFDKVTYVRSPKVIYTKVIKHILKNKLKHPSGIIRADEALQMLLEKSAFRSAEQIYEEILSQLERISNDYLIMGIPMQISESKVTTGENNNVVEGEKMLNNLFKPIFRLTHLEVTLKKSGHIYPQDWHPLNMKNMLKYLDIQLGYRLGLNANIKKAKITKLPSTMLSEMKRSTSKK